MLALAPTTWVRCRDIWAEKIREKEEKEKIGGEEMNGYLYACSHRLLLCWCLSVDRGSSYMYGDVIKMDQDMEVHREESHAGEKLRLKDVDFRLATGLRYIVVG